ncbi:hypothetical protein [Gottfriedia solisilvae]|uniref:Uncharacterized protein n=1 Tax=Gottfriedia solisilvae TaxID=1516104 RepID=A0A8J3AFS8_9BACI|nr:hypothetical protein [Gottfriedia solisilvae]GGI11844.1 hypothetical protein GCM10007380_09880 [Gottfriedia solisilvae]
MKKREIFWSVSLFLSFLGFYLIENVFTIKPNVISGNGNLAILAILFFSPIFITSYFLTYKQARQIANNTKNRKIAVILSCFIVCFTVLIFILVDYTSELFVALGGTPSNPDSRIYRFGWFNQYTNSIYFNVYTFLLTHIMVVIVGILSFVRKNN